MTTDSSARQSDDPSTPSKVQIATAEDAPEPLSFGYHLEMANGEASAYRKSFDIDPELRRHATNTSMLNEVIWSNPGADDDSTTSSSSSGDDGDVEPPVQKQQRQGRPREGAAEQAEGHPRGSMSATMISRRRERSRRETEG